MNCKPKIKRNFYCIFTDLFLDKTKTKEERVHFSEILREHDVDLESDDTMIYYVTGYPFKGDRNALYYKTTLNTPHKAVYFNCWNEEISCKEEQEEEEEKDDVKKKKIKKTIKPIAYLNNELTLNVDYEKRLIDVIVIINCVYGPGISTYCSFFNVKKNLRLFTDKTEDIVVDPSANRLCWANVKLARENYQRQDLNIDDLLNDDDLIRAKRERIDTIYNLSKNEFTENIHDNTFRTFLSFLIFYYTYVLNGSVWCIKYSNVPVVEGSSCFDYNISNYDLISYYINVNRLLENQYYVYFQYDDENDSLCERYLKPLYVNSIFRLSPNLQVSKKKVGGIVVDRSKLPIVDFNNCKRIQEIPKVLGGCVWSNPSLQTTRLINVSLDAYVYNYDKVIGCIREDTRLIDDIFRRYLL